MPLQETLRGRFGRCVEKIPWKMACSPLQSSCLENLMDGAAWQAIVHRVVKSRTQLKGLNTTTIRDDYNHLVTLDYVQELITEVSQITFM